MTEQEKQKYYGNEAFETIYEKTKKDYTPQLISYTPLSEKTLAERIGAVLRPVYEKAIAAIFRENRRTDAELDADAISRGMGTSTFVTDMKRRQDNAAMDDVRALENEYGAEMADQLHKAMEGERDRQFEVEKFNAQQQNVAQEQAFSAAKTLYTAYVEAKAAQEQAAKEQAALEQAAREQAALEEAAREQAARSSGGGGGTSKKKEKKTATEAQTKTSLAQAVATARGQLQADPNGPAFYAKGNQETVNRVVNSDLPKYVKMRGELNGDLTARDLNKFRTLYEK